MLSLPFVGNAPPVLMFRGGPASRRGEPADDARRGHPECVSARQQGEALRALPQGGGSPRRVSRLGGFAPLRVSTMSYAKAGARNHRLWLLRESRPTVSLKNNRRGVWVPAFAGTTLALLKFAQRPFPARSGGRAYG